MTRIWLSCLSITILVFLDQITKHLSEVYIKVSEEIRILGFLNFVNVRNTGAAFGLFKGLGNLFFIIISVIAIGVIIYLLWKGKDEFIGLLLVLSGAVGNLIDRVFLDYVRDFIDFHIRGLHWPAFNLADSYLTIGIAYIILVPAIRKKIKRGT